MTAAWATFSALFNKPRSSALALKFEMSHYNSVCTKLGLLVKQSKEACIFFSVLKPHRMGATMPPPIQKGKAPGMRLWGLCNKDTIFRGGGWRLQKETTIFFVVWWVVFE